MTALKFKGSLHVRPPGDKSLTHRALILGALATGKSSIADPLIADDTRSTVSVLRKLGARMSPFRRGEPLQMDGGGLEGLNEPTTRLDCGNSGTAARLFLGVLSGSSISGEITGDDSLRTRPMQRVTEPLRRMGADIEGLHGDKLPMLVRGRRLRSLDYEPPVASAQVKSALLLAGLMGRATVTVRERIRTRDHTERMLSALGATIEVAAGAVTFQPTEALLPFAIRIPGDPSSAAFLIAAALLSSGGPIVVEGVSLNSTRTAFLDVLKRMGAVIQTERTSVEFGEPVGDVLIERSSLCATEVTAVEVPWLIDEIPVLATLASRVDGETVFRTVTELRVKESDRLAAITENLVAIGGDAWVEGEDLYVRGREHAYSGVVDTALDHRIAMAFASLNVHESVDLQLSEDRSPRISYPEFFEDLARVVQRA